MSEVNEKPMTVAELRAVLVDLPDDMPLYRFRNSIKPIEAGMWAVKDNRLVFCGYGWGSDGDDDYADKLARENAPPPEPTEPKPTVFDPNDEEFRCELIAYVLDHPNRSKASLRSTVAGWFNGSAVGDFVKWFADDANLCALGLFVDSSYDRTVAVIEDVFGIVEAHRAVQELEVVRGCDI